MQLQKEVLKQKLGDERVRLLEDISQLGILGEAHSGYGNHMADDATEVFEQARNLSLREVLKQKLQQVEAAMVRFDEGTYGICEDCGQEIDPARLKAEPSARLCLSCTVKRETRR